MTRRKSLLAAFAIPGAILQSGLAAANPGDDLLGGCRYKRDQDGPVRFSLIRIQPTIGKVDAIDTPIFPHGLTAYPLNRQRVFAFEKIGRGAGVIDLATMRWQSAIAPVEDRRFYGHAACSPDGEFLYSTETTGTGLGAIGIRDAKTLRYLGDFPTYGTNPHDCMLIEAGQTMVVSNGGGSAASAEIPCVSYIDVRTRKLLEQSTMTDSRFNTGHLAVLPGRESVVVSAPRLGLGVDHPGAISRQKPGQELAVFKSPALVTDGLLGEALSVLAMPARDLIVVTHPTPGLLSFWRLASGAYVKSLPLSHARGIALSVDGQTLWVSYGTSGSLQALSLNTLKLLPETRLENTSLVGSHLFNHKLMS